ncbi:hypothetical protein OESDEN_00492 [Oesophagostomum dentatum]|uniref:Uncharacterized protein n=1 Tax=Oesophagostomum dentatum TaxID=61180 RepID=A0A0B1TTP4_OESDE|nr:hypothetical protein OESDEN_00492 [Oesophagostomum dentatum]
MSLASLLCGRLVRLLHSILGLFKRALCFMRKRENIGELPFTVVVNQSTPDDPYPSAVTSSGWDEHWCEKQDVEDKIEEWRRKKILKNETSNPHSEDVDFFNDMQPDIKKAKKIVLKPKSSQRTRENRNLFGYTDDSNVDVVRLVVYCIFF